MRSAVDALALFITFRCYGTWLPGDPRGWAQRGVQGVQPPDARLQRICRARMRHPPARLDRERRSDIDDAMRSACGGRGWLVRALNVRTEHVHTAVAAQGDPDRIMGYLKARATHALREAGLWPRNRPVWAVHGSTRWLYSHEALQRVCHYIIHEQ